YPTIENYLAALSSAAQTTPTEVNFEGVSTSRSPFNAHGGEMGESREHILCACPRKISRDVFLPDIHGTKQGITALIEFLKASGAFSRTGPPAQSHLNPHPSVTNHSHT
ncbi:hypothetical protein CVT26_013008, partial [Gymnopilus dilepis]